MDRAAEIYLSTLVERVGRILDDRLVGAYLVNSGARGDYLPGRSDLDVAVVAERSLPPPLVGRLADALRHRSLACPAPRLELVVYRRADAASRGPLPAFELNLNTGPAIDDHVTTDAAGEPLHWFVLDLAAAAQRAGVLHGPPPQQVFGAPPRSAVLDALRASRAWHEEHETTAPDRVLNECRAWMWIESGRWASKSEAAAWAVAAGGDRELIERALARRRGDTQEPLPGDHVAALATAVAERLSHAAAQQPQ